MRKSQRGKNSMKFIEVTEIPFERNKYAKLVRGFLKADIKYAKIEFEGEN